MKISSFDNFGERTTARTSIKEARAILGEATKNMTDDEVKDQITEIQFLVESWLNDFERSIFDGKTINEMLRFR